MAVHLKKWGVSMSITNIRQCYDIKAALEYQQTKNGRDRCAAKRSNTEPFNYNNLARMVIESTNRKIQGYTIIQAFSPEELDNTPENVELVNLIGCELAARAFSGCAYQVITHNDKGHLHNHITVLNYDLDTGKCINRDCRWLHLSRVNDKLMGDYGLEVCKAKTRQADQKAYFDKKRNPDKYIWQEDLQDRVKKALDNAISPRDFALRLKAEGVMAKINGKNGKPLKHMVFIFKGKDGKEHRKRGSNMNIGNGFTQKELTEAFEQNAAKAKQPTPPKGVVVTSEANTATAETLTKTAGRQKAENATKAHPKTANKPKEIEPSVVIPKRKKQKMMEEEERGKRIQLQQLLSRLQQEKEDKQKERDKIKEKLDTISKTIDKSADAKEVERLGEEEKQLQQQHRDLEMECLLLHTKEQQLNDFLSGKKETIDPQLELGLERSIQKQRDSEGIYFD